MLRKKTNPALKALVRDLRKRSWDNDAPIWRDVAKRLEKPASSWSEVNVSRLDRNTKSGDTAVVPGKLLGAGDLTKEVTVAAYNFSRAARDKVEAAGGECLSLTELVDRTPQGTDVRIIG